MNTQYHCRYCMFEDWQKKVGPNLVCGFTHEGRFSDQNYYCGLLTNFVQLVTEGVGGTYISNKQQDYYILDTHYGLLVMQSPTYGMVSSIQLHCGPYVKTPTERDLLDIWEGQLYPEQIKTVPDWWRNY